MTTLMLAMCLACGPRGQVSGPLFVPAPVMVPKAMPKAISVPVAFRVAPVRTVIHNAYCRVVRLVEIPVVAVTHPVKTVGYVLTPWRR